LRSGLSFQLSYWLKMELQSSRATLKNNFTDNMSFIDLLSLCLVKFNIQAQSERYFRKFRKKKTINIIF
jgi:hypothetical protein